MSAVEVPKLTAGLRVRVPYPASTSGGGTALWAGGQLYKWHSARLLFMSPSAIDIALLQVEGLPEQPGTAAKPQLQPACVRAGARGTRADLQSTLQTLQTFLYPK